MERKENENWNHLLGRHHDAYQGQDPKRENESVKVGSHTVREEDLIKKLWILLEAEQFLVRVRFSVIIVVGVQEGFDFALALRCEQKKWEAVLERKGHFRNFIVCGESLVGNSTCGVLPVGSLRKRRHWENPTLLDNIIYENYNEEIDFSCCIGMQHQLETEFHHQSGHQFSLLYRLSTINRIQMMPMGFIL